nr:MAG: hypothetical protein [Bacteriophage sp.]
MESKTVVYTPEAGGGNSGMMAMLAPLLQQKGIDPNLLVAMNGKNGNNGFGGDGSWFMWIIFLFFLFPLFGRNGWGGNDGGCGGGAGAPGLAGLINNDNGRELLMSAIQGNGQAINNLATNLNCNVEVFTYPNAIVSDKKEAILSEVENMIQTSRQIVESRDYHQSVIESCDNILKQLNPQFAKEKQQEEKIGSLESEVKSLKGDLNDIKSLLQELNSSNRNSKTTSKT